ncbi:MAG: hypothetical protein WD096_10970 [Actinomycetota bacterium]
MEALSEEVRRLGFSLNDSKTHIYSKAKYVEWITASDTAWSDITLAVEFDFQGFDPYSGEFLTSEEEEDEDGDDAAPSDEQIVEAASRALRYWRERVEPGTVPPRVLRRLLTQSLDSLGFRHGDDALEHCLPILRKEPQYAKAVGRYLSRIRDAHPQAVARLIESWTVGGRQHLSPWQSQWIGSALLPPTPLSQDMAAWVREHTGVRWPGSLRSRMAYVLARHGRWEVEELGALYEQLGPAARPDLVAAAAAIGDEGEPTVRAIVDDGPLNRWIYDSVRERL